MASWAEILDYITAEPFKTFKEHKDWPLDVNELWEEKVD